MRTLLFSLILMAGTFLGHLLLWRIWKPRRPTLVLLGVFLGGLGIGVTILEISGWLPGAGSVLRVSLFHVAFSLAYIVAYSGIEAASPSLTLARAVERAGVRGCSRADLEEVVSDREFLEPRLLSLETSGAVVVEGDRVQLTSQGLGWARLMKLVSDSFLNLPKGA